MNKTEITYIVFIGLILLALLFDLGLMSKKNKVVTLKAALIQTFFWVALAFAFCIFVYFENIHGQGKEDVIQYISAYLLEWSLSIDNIFVFIIIFSFFKVKEEHYSRVLLLGILMAIVFRILFIAIGSELVARFSWVMYVFGIFLVITGLKMFNSGDDEEFEPGKNWAYRLMRKMFRTTDEEPNGKFVIYKDGKRHYTTLFMVVVMLGLIDLVFAVDSIPAVFSIIPDPSKKMLIYSSNIFAVLGLRSLFFLLKGAASRFDYLQQGIAVVLFFIGIKMLLPLLAYAGVHNDYLHMPVWISLLVIVACIGGSILYSIYQKKEDNTEGDT